MGNKFVVIDLETTGNAPKKEDRIIQIGAVVIENGVMTRQYSTLINPNRPIPAFIEELTGINDEMVEKAPEFAQVAHEVIELLDDAYFVAHNVLFDLGFLQEELQRAGYDGFYGTVIDTVELSRILFPTADGYTLSDLAENHGFSHDRPHQADSDAYVTAQLLLMMLNKLNTFPLATIKQLTKLSSGLKSDIYLLLEEIMAEKIHSVEEMPPEIEIYRGIALKSKQVEPSTKDTRSFSNFTITDNKVELLQKGLPSFEKRIGQMQMIDSVHQAFTGDKHALIEAGTGIGKTLGYLVPAIIFSKRYQKSIVISTYTTQLQQQLLMNDLPKLVAMFDFQIKAVVLKGRDHYLNLAKFERTLMGEEDNYDTTLTKMQILVWLMETETGDFDELNLSGGGNIYWNKIKNTPIHFSQTSQWDSRDFYFRARKNAKEANLIITNHSLLLTDLLSNEPFIPPYEYVVLDEVHHFEKMAGKHLGKAMDYLAVRTLLNAIGQYDQGQKFQRLEQLCERLKVNDVVLKWSSYKLNELIKDAQYEMDRLFSALAAFAKRKARDSISLNRIQAVLANNQSKEWRAFFGSAERFSFILKDVHSGLNERIIQIQHAQKPLKHDDEDFLDECTNMLKELDRIRKTTRELFLSPEKGQICWVETDLRSVQNMTTVYGRPANVSQYLKDEFFASKKSVVMTSATMTVNDSFEFIKKELGIDSTPVIEEQISSPFDYEKQVQLVIPDDLPDIKSVDETEYIVAITEHIISIAEAAKGRMLTLFTSHEMLKKTYELIKESGLLDEFVLLAQGITPGSRGRLIKNFQRFDKAILFGTNSFWEGIDIPGEDLSCLIIVRLPFSSPDEPLSIAKREQIISNGGNPFYELSLPEAVLRFKQGFGRLIRTSQDRGIVFIFDRRVITTSYGKAFLRSIPPVPITRASIEEIVYFLHKWL